jgi:hypothetical protein
MKRNLIFLLCIYGILAGLLYWLVRGYPGDTLHDKFQYLIYLLREDNTMLLKVAIVYAVSLSIPYLPGGLGWVIVIVTGFKGVVIFILGSMASLALNFIIGRRFPIIMKYLKREIAKHLSQKEWWPQGENLNIFRIIGHYFEEDHVGKKFYAFLQRLPIRFKFNEKNIILMILLLPVNIVVGGGGGVGLICGEECTLSFFQFMKCVFYAHVLYAIIPWGVHLLLR